MAAMFARTHSQQTQRLLQQLSKTHAYFVWPYQRWNLATPGRGLKPTRGFPANPKRFPALAPVFWFGNPRFITQNNLQPTPTNSSWRPASPLRFCFSLCALRVLCVRKESSQATAAQVAKEEQRQKISRPTACA